MRITKIKKDLKDYESTKTTEELKKILHHKHKKWNIYFSSSLICLLHHMMMYADRIMKTDEEKEFLELLNEAERNCSLDYVMLLRILQYIEEFLGDKDTWIPESLSYPSPIFEEQIDYYYPPYKITEMIIGARRFLLAHELAHIINGTTEGNNISLAKTTGSLKDGTFKVLYDYTPEQANIAFSDDIEYSTDTLAFQMILNCYPEVSEISESDMFELNNTINGISLYFSLLNLIEGCEGKYLQTNVTHHPLALFRRYNIMTLILKNNIGKYNKDFYYEQSVFDAYTRAFDSFFLLGSYQENKRINTDRWKEFIKEMGFSKYYDNHYIFTLNMLTPENLTSMDNEVFNMYKSAFSENRKNYDGTSSYLDIFDHEKYLDLCEFKK